MLHEVSFKSYNQRDEVQGWIYVPAKKPKGIMQLVHGFGEHSRRYFHMIVAMMDAGYIVAADDHVGHGKTAMVNDVWSDWGDKGYETMREDEHTLTKIVKEKYPHLPYFIYGHSLGSIITRDYIANYGDEVDGVIICGTPGKFKNLEESARIVNAAVDDGKGDDRDPNMGAVMMGWMGERIENYKIGNEWICHDPMVQIDHAEDPFDAFTKPTTNRSYSYFLKMFEVIYGPEWAAKVPKTLPVYNIGGDQDPVTDYGTGIYLVSNWLIENGNPVTTKVYSGYRHEIHNYDDIKCEVEQGIVDFMDSVVSK